MGFDISNAPLRTITQRLVEDVTDNKVSNRNSQEAMNDFFNSSYSSLFSASSSSLYSVSTFSSEYDRANDVEFDEDIAIHSRLPDDPNHIRARKSNNKKEQQSQNSRRRVVSFSKKKHVRKIPHCNDLSQKLVDRCWYSQEELEEVKSSEEYIIFMMDSGEEKIDDEEATSRGLENKTNDGAWKRYNNRRSAYDAVMNEQDRQWTASTYDDDLIAQKYAKISEKCHIAAVKKGLQDEDDINAYMNDARLEELKRLTALFSYCNKSSMQHIREDKLRVKGIIKLDV